MTSSAQFGGDAVGGGNDKITGGTGTGANLLEVIGDSYAKQEGNAIGGGNDTLRYGESNDGLVIGDSLAPNFGDASGSGSDTIAGSRGADTFLVGDNAANLGNVSGGGRDEIQGLAGDDTMFGDNVQGDGISVPNGPYVDRCYGGPGFDEAIDCEATLGVP